MALTRLGSTRIAPITTTVTAPTPFRAPAPRPGASITAPSISRMGAKTTLARRTAEKRAVANKMRTSGSSSKVQGAINKILGATPEDPLQIPIALPTVPIEAKRKTQNLVIGGIALLALTAVGITLIAKK